MWKGRIHFYRYSEVWGCAKSSILASKRTKVGPKTMDCVFICYALHINTYRFLVINSKNNCINKNTIFEARNT